MNIMGESLMELQAFIEKHQQGQNLQKATQSKLDQYSNRLPASILELWRGYGLGSSLKNDEIYSFVPVLALGGAAEVQFIEKANALVHMDLLFQM
jgi:hypothetical protein